MQIIVSQSADFFLYYRCHIRRFILRIVCNLVCLTSRCPICSPCKLNYAMHTPTAAVWPENVTRVQFLPSWRPTFQTPCTVKQTFTACAPWQIASNYQRCPSLGCSRHQLMIQKTDHHRTLKPFLLKTPLIITEIHHPKLRQHTKRVQYHTNPSCVVCVYSGVGLIDQVLLSCSASEVCVSWLALTTTIQTDILIKIYLCIKSYE